jgi:hypothetical protein
MSNYGSNLYNEGNYSYGPVIAPDPGPGTGPPSTDVGTGLTFLDIQNELVRLRFGEGRRANVKQWINAKYRDIFVARDWSFRQVYREPVHIDAQGFVSATATPFTRVYALELADGTALSFVQPNVARENFPINLQTRPNPPEQFFVVDRVVRVQPPPSGIVDAYISYQRAVCCRMSTGQIKAGSMLADNDYPIWSQEHHYLLVTGAMALGLKNVNDPTWQALEADYGLAVDAMADDYFPTDTYGNQQFGRQLVW